MLGPYVDISVKITTNNNIAVQILSLSFECPGKRTRILHGYQHENNGKDYHPGQRDIHGNKKLKKTKSNIV